MGQYDLYTNKRDCCGCGACKDICPVNAIDMVIDEEGFAYPAIVQEKCTDCGQCKEVCPIKARQEKKEDKLYFGIQVKNEKIRASSSSGGMFSVLAQYVFSHQGVVYGAAFNDSMEVIHMEAHDMDDLERLRKTKYVQSSLEGIYQSIKERLNDGRWVLFCGTPCQAQALRLFIGKDCPRLITVDLVCYGVPSPGIWKRYVKYLEKKHGGKMTEFYFRDKRNRDNGHTCAYVIDGTEYAYPLNRDAYCRMYFRDYILRPSCHGCSFCTTERGSDFTVGDFWGIEQIRPDMDDGMGTSMVIIHSDKGKAVWDQVRNEVHWFSCGKADVLQPRLQTPTGVSRSRKQFMALYRLIPFSWLLKWVRSRVFSLVR